MRCTLERRLNQFLHGKGVGMLVEGVRFVADSVERHTRESLSYVAK